jgi:hypothetical protein
MKRVFFCGVLPSKYSGRWRNNADEVLAKLFFGERICQNFGSFLNSDVANGKGGVWGGIFHLPLFFFWGNSGGIGHEHIIS